jgi:hypothetical protein
MEPQDFEHHATTDLIEGLDGCHRSIGHTQRRLFSYIAACESRKVWLDDDCRDMAQWVSLRLGISSWEARRYVAAAHALAGLPKTATALEAGTLCLDKVLELTRFATPETEDKLLKWARRVSAACIRSKADLAQRSPEEDAQEIENCRRLKWWYFDDDKRMGLEGEFPAAEGAAIAARLRRIADDLPDLATDEPGYDPYPEDLLERRCADALYVLAAEGSTRDSAIEAATVVVHTALGDDHSLCHLEDGGILHALTDTRQPTACPEHGTQFHRAWHHGGPTELHNLVTVCHFHHKLVHEFGWNVALKGSEAWWFRPNGSRFEPGPDPPRSRLGPPLALSV